MQPGKPLIEQELAELERLADEATPGPWFIDQETGMIYSADGYLIDQDMTAEDILFICAANPQTILSLIAQIREHQSKNKALSELMRWSNRDDHQQKESAASLAREEISVCESCGAFGGYHSEQCTIYAPARPLDDQPKLLDTTEHMIKGCHVTIRSYANDIHTYLIEHKPCKFNMGSCSYSHGNALAAAGFEIDRHMSQCSVQPAPVVYSPTQLRFTPAEVAENRLIDAARSALDFLERYFDGVDSYGARVRIDELTKALALFDEGDRDNFSPHQQYPPPADHTWYAAVELCPQSGQKVVCLDRTGRGWYARYNADTNVYWQLTGTGHTTGQMVTAVEYWRPTDE